MEYTLHWSKLHQLHKIVLTVFSANKVSKRLYEEYGFVIEGVQKDQLLINGGFQDEIYMANFINSN